MKNPDERAIIQVVIATGISSVVTQLVVIREFLTLFQGNEIVIALILFNWLMLGGIGTLLARGITRRRWHATPARLGWLSLWLCGLAPLQLLAARMLRDIIFIHGSSVGFYPTWLYILCAIMPYCLLLGFVLPYSLFVLRTANCDYPGAGIYITDNIGDICGGVLFSFVLVHVVSPLQAIFWAHLPLLASTFFLFRAAGTHCRSIFAGLTLTAGALVAGLALETVSLTPSEGQLAHYRETRYGRIAVHQDREQYTLFEDGTPVFSNQNISGAEEAVHFALAQVEHARHVLLVSSAGGIMEELQKYALASVDYVELDPEVTEVQFRFNLLKRIPGLHVIHQDGRAFLAQTDKRYDAILVNLPEPQTFQINRFYTDRFFSLAAEHLSPGGVLSFAMQGFDNYLAEVQRQKLSSLYNTVRAYFRHVVLLPGQKVFFLCRNQPITTDIPAALAEKGISTSYISGFYHGNLTAERIQHLNERMDAGTPKNVDHAPYLMRIMFSQWFAMYQTSPLGFILGMIMVTGVYLFRITREEFVLFSTGCLTMGAEILVIFAFQIYFGYVYLQIGIIITVFLAGLLPGAWMGNRRHRQGQKLLAFTDGLLIVLLIVFVLGLGRGGDHLPVAFFLVFGFAVSLACGFQFPVALHLRGSDNAAATRSFSADLIGAAFGILFTSAVLIPYVGLIWATTGLIALKLISLVRVGMSKNLTFA